MGISYDTQLVTCNRYEDALAKEREDPCRKAYPKTTDADRRAEKRAAKRRAATKKRGGKR